MSALRGRLTDARLYLCTDARERQGDLADFLDAVLSSGVDIIQLRQKGIEARPELEALAVFRAAAARHGRLLAVNDRADVALAGGADILHLGQDDVPVTTAQGILGADVLIGRSAHDRAQVDAAVDSTGIDSAGIDYFCVGPTWPTPTKPGRHAPGLALTRHAASRRGSGGTPASLPWFAIGGIDLDNLDQVLDAGARRVVVVRAVTEASDPGAAAAAFAQRLREAAAADPAG